MFDTMGPFLQLTEFGLMLKDSGYLLRVLRRETIHPRMRTRLESSIWYLLVIDVI